MHDINYFKQPSPTHTVQEENQGFSIAARGDSPEHVAAFQVVAREALRYRGEDYEVRPAPSRPPYDLVYFMRTD